METMLLVVTIISVSGAIGLSVIGWRILRRDRQGEDARVATLETLAFDLPLANIPAPPAARFTTLDDPPPAGPAILDPVELKARTPISVIAPRPVARVETTETTETIGAMGAMNTMDSMFARPQPSGAPMRRWAALAGVAGVMALGAGTVYGLRAPGASLVPGLRSSDTSSATTAPSGHALELVSLKHDAGSDSTFTVTGLVENPADGVALSRVEALVYLFDDHGNYFAMGRSAIAFSALQPGDASPFVVRIPQAAHVGRYRVVFRLEGGGAVAHVDKRSRSRADLAPESGS